MGPPVAAAGSAGRSLLARKVGCGCAPAIIIVAVVVVLLGTLGSCDPDAIGDRIDDALSTSNVITLSGSATVLSADEGSTEVIATIQDTSGSETTRRLALVRFSGDRSTEVWRSEPLDDGAARASIAVVGDTIFAGLEDQLLALDAQTGETNWRSQLRDKVTSGCPGCFAAVGDHLVVRTADAYVSAYGTKSAEQLWSKRLNSTVESVSVVGDRLFVVDDPEDASQLTTVQLLDPATGRTLRTVAPTCPPSDSTPWTLEMGPDERVYGVPNGQDVLAAFGFGDGCVVRWNPGTGAVRWATRFDGIGSIDDRVVIGTDDIVIAATAEALPSVALADGRARMLPVPSDSTATPNVIVGRTLIADTVTTRGTSKGGLIGWDLATADRLWAIQTPTGAVPVTQNRYFSSDALFDGAPRSLLAPSSDGLELFVFEGEQRTFSAQRLDPESGRLGEAVRRGFLTRYDSGTISLTIEAVTDHRLVISTDSLLQTIPSSGRGPIVPFPDDD